MFRKKEIFNNLTEQTNKQKKTKRNKEINTGKFHCSYKLEQILCSELTTFKSVGTGTKKEKIPKVQHFSNKSPAKGENVEEKSEGKGRERNKKKQK